MEAEQQIPIGKVQAVDAEKQRMPGLPQNRLPALRALGAHVPHFHGGSEFHLHGRVLIRPGQELLHKRHGLKVPVRMQAQPGPHAIGIAQRNEIGAIER